MKLRFKRRATACATALASLVVLAACGLGDGGARSGDTIVIGGSLSLTGPLSLTGVEYKKVYDLWAENVNDAGGILGRTVELNIKNDNSTPATAQSIYQNLVSTDRVDLLLAPYGTSTGAPIVTLARSAGYVLFNGGFAGVQYFNESKGSMVASYTYQEPEFPRALFEAIKELPDSDRPEKAAILAANSPFPLVARDGYDGDGGAKRFAVDAGIEVVFDETYAPTTTDFTAAVTRARASGADLFVVLGLPPDSNNIIKAAHALGYQPKFICACGAQVTTLPSWPDLGDAAEGVIGQAVAWPSQKNPGAEVIEEFARSQGLRDVPSYYYTAYAILQVLQQAIEGTGSLDQEKLKAYLHSHSFDTAVGAITYNANGTTNYGGVLTQTIGGEQYAVWPPAAAEHELEAQQ